MQVITSAKDNVKIEVDPNNVVQTSALIFDDVGNKFISRYPIANEPTASIATAASPLIFAFVLLLNKMIAARTVIGKESIILLVNPTTAATAIVQKAICDNPSPINENLLSTNVTPNKEEHNAIKIPTIKAYLTKGNSK